MSNVQIPNLPVAIALNGTEALEAVQSGTSVQTTVSQIAQYSYAYYPGFYISQLPAAATGAATDLIPVLQGSTGPGTGTTRKITPAQLSITATGSTTSRTLANRFADTVNVKDFGAVGDGVTDDTAAIQAAINSRTSGGGVYFPRGVYLTTGLRLDGSAGGLNNITLSGEGPGSELKMVAGNTSNVIRTVSGSGYSISNLRIRGALGNGVVGLVAPSKGFWAVGISYLIGDTVEVSSADVATTTVAASNLVYVSTTNHISGATFLADKAANWIISANPNYNTVDISYATRNGIYLDGATNSSVDGCDIIGAVYAGLNIGTGPVQAANAGPGSSYIRVSNSNFDNCGSGIAGGKQTYCTISGNTFKSCSDYGIALDAPSNSSNLIVGNTIVGMGNHGIFLYGASTATVTGNTVSYCVGIGIFVDNGSGSCTISSNTCTQNVIGIRVNNSSISTVVGNACRANAQYGIDVIISSQVAITGNNCDNNGYEGIRLSSCSAFSLSGNNCTTNLGLGGIYLDGCSGGTISGGQHLNNNNSGIPSINGAGVYINNSTSISVVGVSAYDTRAGAAKTQKYGVRSLGTSDAVNLAGNTLTGNLTATPQVTR